MGPTTFSLERPWRPGLSLVLARLHQRLPVGARVVFRIPTSGDAAADAPSRETIVDLVEGAGFEAGRWRAGTLGARRAEMLPDTVADRTLVLVVGLNPSVRSTATGCAFAGPGNRFWPAVTAAGLVGPDRDPFAAAEAGLALTNLVRRTTAAASELHRDEYRAGVSRVERLIGRAAPAVVCFVGLAGYRAVFDARATPGIADRMIAGVPVYVMPSTSGLNARTSLAELTAHFRTVAALAAPGGIRR